MNQRDCEKNNNNLNMNIKMKNIGGNINNMKNINYMPNKGNIKNMDMSIDNIENNL